MDHKFIIQNLFCLLTQKDFFNLRCVSKKLKQLTKAIIQKNPYLMFRLSCAKTFALLGNCTNADDYRKIKNDVKRLDNDVKSELFFRTDYVKHCFNKKSESVLTFENHNFGKSFPNWSLIELDAILSKENDRLILDLNEETNDTKLLGYLHDPERGGVLNMSVDEEREDWTFVIDANHKHLEIHVNRKDYIWCTLFWWYQRFEEMPPNGTKFKYLKLEDGNQEMLAIKLAKISKDFLWKWVKIDKKYVKFIHRSEWDDHKFKDMPLFITDHPDWE